MWFDIIGITLGFMGSVIFSAGLIKSKQQIRDENATYWGTNPYTLGALNSQPYYIAAFALIITGFAVSLGGMLGDQLGGSSMLVSILFAVAISFIGYFGIAILFIHQINAHQKRKDGVAKRVYKSKAKDYASKMRAMEAKENADAQFASAKPLYVDELKIRANAIPKQDSEQEIALNEELRSEDVDTPKLFREAVERYIVT